MSFQFQCPQGHLLEGDPSQAGQAVNCPSCGMLFIIPAPLAPAVGPEMAPVFGSYGHQPQSRFAHLQVAGEGPAATTEVESAPVMEEPAPPPEPELLHIPCPNGHELETPVDMLEQEVLCPQCNAQFRLRKQDSVEFKRKQEEQERIKEIKTGNFWLNMAVVAVVLVGLLILGLIILSTFGNAPAPTGPEKKKSAALIVSPRALLCVPAPPFIGS